MIKARLKSENEAWSFVKVGGCFAPSVLGRAEKASAFPAAAKRETLTVCTAESLVLVH